MSFRMKPEHRYALKLKLDKLWYEGWVKFDRWELLSFFDQKRVTKSVWREIENMWADMFSEPDKADKLSYVTVRSEESVTTPHSFLLINEAQRYDIK